MIERGTLRDYQIEDLAFHMANPRSANLSDPGTGKTPTACAWMSWLWEEKGIRSFWTQPKSLLRKNAAELLKFSNFHPSDIAIVDGTKQQREAAILSGAKVFLMGFTQFSANWKRMKQIYPDLDAVCVDEWQMGYSTHDSARTQDLYEAMRHLKWFLPLTGSVVRGRLTSVYPMITIINPLYYASVENFEYVHSMKDFAGNFIGWRNHEKLKEIFDRHARRHSFKEVYGEENYVIIPERCPMSPKQREAYDEFEETAMLELDDAFLTTANPAVAVMRCAQIMAHPEAIPHPSGLGTYDLMEGEKTGKDLLLDIHLNNHLTSGEPLIIYAQLVPEQERILRRVREAGLTGELINGNVSAKRRGEIDEEFKAGKFQVLVGSPATATVGFNWGHVNHIIFASIDYMDDTFIQAFRRAIRGKRDCPLLITLLEYEKSIDQRKFAIVQAKSLDANKVDNTYQALNLVGNAAPLPEGPKATGKDGMFALDDLFQMAPAGPAPITAPVRRDGKEPGQRFGLEMLR
jgi:SNF2 family DNA or RNA helicase